MNIVKIFSLSIKQNVIGVYSMPQMKRQRPQECEIGGEEMGATHCKVCPSFHTISLSIAESLRRPMGVLCSY
jgi:hypothetical protein